jgi:5-methylcytosine-specific restriction endonuclease McrA
MNLVKKPDNSVFEMILQNVGAEPSTVKAKPSDFSLPKSWHEDHQEGQLAVDVAQNEKEVIYTQDEYETFRQEVLKRDDYKCQYCENKAEHVHHIRPQKLEPFFSLDPDYAISVCKDCHYKYGHQDECSTGNIANIICKKNEVNS